MATVLVVEDNPANMTLATFLLKSAGYAVLTATDAEAGLALARREQPDLVLMDIQLPGMDGLEVARVFLFFSFVHRGVHYPCALVQWFSKIGDEPDNQTGLQMVEPEIYEDSRPYLAIIHLNSIARAAHLTPAYHTSNFVRRSLTMHDALDQFKVFYINKYIDHHAFDFIS